MTSAMVVHKSVELLPNCFVIKIFLHPSASGPYGPAPPLVSNAAFLLSQHQLRQTLLHVLVLVYLSVKYLTVLLFPVNVFVVTGSGFF